MNPNLMDARQEAFELHRILHQRRMCQKDNVLQRHCRLRRCRLKSSGVSYEWTLSSWAPIISS